MRFTVAVKQGSGVAFTVGPFYSAEYAEATCAALVAEGHKAEVAAHLTKAEALSYHQVGPEGQRSKAFQAGYAKRLGHRPGEPPFVAYERLAKEREAARLAAA